MTTPSTENLMSDPSSLHEHAAPKGDKGEPIRNTHELHCRLNSLRPNSVKHAHVNDFLQKKGPEAWMRQYEHKLRKLVRRRRGWVFDGVGGGGSFDVIYDPETKENYLVQALPADRSEEWGRYYAQHDNFVQNMVNTALTFPMSDPMLIRLLLINLGSQEGFVSNLQSDSCSHQ